MVSYPLPALHTHITATSIKLMFRDEKDTSRYISLSIAHYLYDVKQCINNHINDWDNIKKITNPYEYIHTNISAGKYSISKIKPLSRAFFKLIEICNTFDLFNNNLAKPITSFHLAEGPGSFIEALTYLRFNTKDVYYGMTLINTTDDSVPGWEKSHKFLQRNENVIIECGADGTGNLYTPDNFAHCKKHYQNSMDFITADGGFDFSVDFNKQEVMAQRLIFSEVAYAITMQSQGGTFILKMFDLFLKSSIDILYILSCFYSNVSIIKPHTSRIANSEKYIVCRDFKFTDTSYMFKKLHSIFVILNCMRINDLCIANLLDLPVPYRFITAIEEINATLGRQQIDNILITLRFIQNKERKGEKLQQIKNSNIQKCIQWCIKNKIPYNKLGYTGNIFLSESSKKYKL